LSKDINRLEILLQKSSGAFSSNYKRRLQIRLKR